MEMVNVRKIFYYLTGLLLCLIGNIGWAQTIVIQPNTVVSVSKTYKNVTLDMTSGSFLITNGATLTIKNSTIKGTLSKDNPLLFNLDKGALELRKDSVKIAAVGIAPHAGTQSLYYAIQAASGTVTLKGSRFVIDKPFSAGLLITLTAAFPTKNFDISNNKFERFHGVLYLIGSDNAVIDNNTFLANSYGNIVNIGNNNKITRNTIYFSGNDRLGNAIDVIDSTNIDVSQNLLFTPTCHGIYVLSSHNVTIDGNRVHGGITYAMTILSFPEATDKDNYLSHILPANLMKFQLSDHITITNNFMSQNRFGIAASDVDGLVVDNNYFVQRFADNDTRKFWTNNATLFSNVSNLSWTNNFYKEAFSQDNHGDNSKSLMLIPFPATGGVSL